jgi:acetoin utilization deacetylase AcuC-like enzyme
LTTPAFAAMTMELRTVAEECCRGRIVAAVEGGYDLQAFAASLDAVVETLSGPLAAAVWPASGIESTRGRDSAAVARRVLAPHWSV